MRLGAIVLLLACAAFPGTLRADGAGHRAMLPADAQEAFLAVGRLNVQGQGFCTATLIAPSTVLTAAHCVIDRRTRRVVAVDRVHFLPGFRIGDYAAHARATAVRLSPRFALSARGADHDLAVIDLTAPVPAAVRPIPVDTAAGAEGALVLVSYGMDRSQIMSIQRGCRVLRRVGATMFTDCLGLPGASGAPILQESGGALRVVGVTSAVVKSSDAAVTRGDVVAVALTRGTFGPLAAAAGADAAR